MTTDTAREPEAGREPRGWFREHSELGICAVLVVLGLLVLTDALRIPTDFAQRGPVGPKAVPVLVGSLLLVVAVLLARDVLRGGRGEAETGEDVDLSAPADWRTVLLLCGAFLANAALIGVVGFPISGAILFWGAAYALGSRAYVRDPLIAAGLSVLTFAVFNNLLGVPLPGGPLMEVF
ncbi:putative tricarboxylic transport membrane protein [Lentzea xinjiangensis]|uniref:Putative tricarboxylic transport membrane protein n=1 Tax=Lentzea xinjiangensis TaxID=402600 RepID=A0A1H9APT0_9PSEU|nr:tripartite tricarboxylate transporter TctB family protein [Lentzea xinjiangensis]SEP78477.1 putative tricarboxylic transport membrane protein [Lentzea xinjiangensis]